jgi:hypothetical protein
MTRWWIKFETVGSLGRLQTVALVEYEGLFESQRPSSPKEMRYGRLRVGVARVQGAEAEGVDHAGLPQLRILH